MLRLLQVVCLVTVLAATAAGENQQSWSHYTYDDEPYTLQCQSDKYRLKASDVITWTRHGVPDLLKDNEHYEFRTVGGVANAELYIKNVTDQLHGIYICHISDSNQTPLDSVVMGLNWGSRLYRDDMDKYGDKIVVGAIASGSTLVLIVSVCLISTFRYLSEESLDKRRQRKEARLHQHSGNNGHNNQAYADVTDTTEQNGQTHGSGTTESSFVHF